MVVRVSRHTLRNDIAAEAEFQRDFRVPQLPLQCSVQAAHVAQPVRPQVQNGGRLLWVVDLLRLCSHFLEQLCAALRFYAVVLAVSTVLLVIAG